MKLTTTAGTEVEVPVTLPDCIRFFVSLPELGGVREFVGYPTPRGEPEEATLGKPDYAPAVSGRRVGVDYLDAGERFDHDRAVTAGKPSPFVFLTPADRAAVEEAAGDVLGYVTHRLRMSTAREGDDLKGLSVLEAIRHRDILRAIADLRAAELAAWQAWEALPLDLTRECGVPLQRVDGPGAESSASALLDAYAGRLCEQATKWSRQHAQQVEQRHEEDRAEDRRRSLESSRDDAAFSAGRDGAR